MFYIYGVFLPFCLLRGHKYGWILLWNKHVEFGTKEEGIFCFQVLWGCSFVSIWIFIYTYISLLDSVRKVFENS